MSKQSNMSGVGPLDRPMRPAGGPRRARRVVGGILLVGVIFAGGWYGRHFSDVRQSAAVDHDLAVAASHPEGQLWTCSMHPQVIRDKPGVCPICHMALTPIEMPKEPSTKAATKASADAHASRDGHGAHDGHGADGASVHEASMHVEIDPAMVQNMGVRLATVERGALSATIRAVGDLKEAAPLQQDINLRVSGWIEKLYANVEGMEVHKGKPLFDLYSPQMQVGIQELIAARKAKDEARKANDSASNDRAGQLLFDAAEQKLLRWGLGEEQVKALAGLDQPPRTAAILSPIDGHVMVKNVYEGSAVQTGDMVMRLSSRKEIWLDARVFEQDLPLVKIGQKVTATVAAQPGRVFSGTISFIFPHLDEKTRTALARVVLPNADHALLEGMYATVLIHHQLADDALLVPGEAIMDTGVRKLVWVSEGAGHFSAHEVTTGGRGDDDRVEVLSGLKAGQRIVASGQFLIDSESKLREAILKHLGQMPSMPGMPGMPSMPDEPSMPHRH